MAGGQVLKCLWSIPGFWHCLFLRLPSLSAAVPRSVPRGLWGLWVSTLPSQEDLWNPVGCRSANRWGHRCQLLSASLSPMQWHLPCCREGVMIRDNIWQGTAPHVPGLLPSCKLGSLICLETWVRYCFCSTFRGFYSGGGWVFCLDVKSYWILKDIGYWKSGSHWFRLLPLSPCFLLAYFRNEP